MSNNGEPWRKFAQTFFLAEQPNGYFVLNDIFRFLKEEVSGEDEYADDRSSLPDDSSAPLDNDPVIQAHPSTAVEMPVPEPAAPTTDAPTPDAVPQSNGHAALEEPVMMPEPEPAEPAPEDTISQSISPAPEPAARSSAPSPSPSPVPPPPAAEPTPTAPKSDPTPQAAPPSSAAPPPSAPQKTGAPSVVAPTPSAPPAPRTWAGLAALNSTKWGSQVAQEAKGVSTAPPPAPNSPAPQRSAGPPGPSRDAQSRDGRGSPAQAAMAVTTGQCFVKVSPHNESCFDLTHMYLLL